MHVAQYCNVPSVADGESDLTFKKKLEIAGLVSYVASIVKLPQQFTINEVIFWFCGKRPVKSYPQVWKWVEQAWVNPCFQPVEIRFPFQLLKGCLIRAESFRLSLNLKSECCFFPSALLTLHKQKGWRCLCAERKYCCFMYCSLPLILEKDLLLYQIYKIIKVWQVILLNSLLVNQTL